MRSFGFPIGLIEGKEGIIAGEREQKKENSAQGPTVIDIQRIQNRAAREPAHFGTARKDKNKADYKDMNDLIGHKINKSIFRDLSREGVFNKVLNQVGKDQSDYKKPYPNNI